MYGERKHARWSGPDWRDIFGPKMTAGQIVAEAQRRGVRVAQLLRQWYVELGRANPHGGWDAENAPNFERLAGQIEAEAEAAEEALLERLRGICLDDENLDDDPTGILADWAERALD